jgi:nitrogen-specific signal transduction histidine kinase
MLEDITQRRAVELERRHLEEQLLQSQKVEAIGRLAGGVAHDFNNILTTVQGYGALLSSQLQSDPTNQHYAQEIVRAAEQAAGLTRQLLAFSRKQPLVAVQMDMNSVVRDIEEILLRLLPNRIHMEIRLDPEAGSVLADPVQIKQVILNLVVNARDAMPQGGHLTLETARLLTTRAGIGLDPRNVPVSSSLEAVEPNEWVRLTVRDTGIGMADDVKRHLFEPFFTTKPRGEGTGLGLATCYGIVKQSQGHLAVESEPGRGATFTVILPRVGDSLPTRPLEPEAVNLPQRGTETVLVVEDTRPLRELVSYVLKGLGYTVLEAEDGEDAVQLLGHHGDMHFDLLLTDVVMPRMGGRELAAHMLVKSPTTRVLYMSGHNEDPDLQQGSRIEGVALLAKPFSPSTLSAAVRAALDG